MSHASLIDRPAVVYPESDGKPMADNTLQFRWIVTIEGGLEALFSGNDNVFVAGDLFWYPVEGQPTIVQAPDTLVVFGRPKGDRGSYRQWEEGGIAPQVVFEILSPNNRPPEMTRKFEFYQRHGVEEYYLYDPDERELFGWIRHGEQLREIASMEGWISPRLQIRFEMASGDLQIFRPDGERFATFVELMAQRQQAERDKQRAERDKQQAEQRAAEQTQTVERLLAQLKGLGVEPDV